MASARMRFKVSGSRNAARSHCFAFPQRSRLQSSFQHSLRTNRSFRRPTFSEWIEDKEQSNLGGTSVGRRAQEADSAASSQSLSSQIQTCSRQFSLCGREIPSHAIDIGAEWNLHSSFTKGGAEDGKIQP